MLGGGLQRGDDALIVIVGVGIHLGEPDDFLGIDALAVHHSGDLAVGAACVKTDAAALQMAAHLLGGVLGLGHLVHQHDLKGVLKDVGHVIKVEVLLAAGGVSLLQIVVGVLVAGYIYLEAALHPQDGLDQTVHIVVIRLGHLWGAVNKGVAGGHLAVGTLHSDGHGLLGRFQEGAVEL